MNVNFAVASVLLSVWSLLHILLPSELRMMNWIHHSCIYRENSQHCSGYWFQSVAGMLFHIFNTSQMDTSHGSFSSNSLGKNQATGLDI